VRILKLYDGDYPWDVRVEKILRSLVNRGHEVTLLARNRQGRPRDEKLPGIAIRRLPGAGRLDMTFPVFFNPVWVREAWATARHFQPDRILVRDLPLAPLGLKLARSLGVPALIDMAEPYPLALRSNWQFDELGGLDHLFRNPRLADLIERWVARRQPRVMVVCEEAGDRLERLGLGRERWTVVHNTPDVEVEELPPLTHRMNPGRTRLIFTGILVGDRGLGVVLEALHRLPEPLQGQVEMLVVGDGPARARWQALARSLGIDARVDFRGWVSHSDLPRYWLDADLGLLPFRDCPHIRHTLANKLFDYMAYGLPVVASDAPPMLRVLNETRAGMAFRADDPDDLARVLVSLIRDPEGTRGMGECGRKATIERYHWRNDEQRLLEALDFE
jgi:glycosyltransferase involved in cell wall biosynthesis